MKERKYKEDWINETRFEGSREKRVPVYRGPLFVFEGGASGKSLALRGLILWGLYLALLLAYFRLDFPGTRALFVFLPAGLSLFPCFYWALGLWGLFRAPEKMTRLQKENGPGRVLRSAVGCGACSLGAVIGDAVFLLTGGSAAAEWPGLLMLLAVGGVAFAAAAVFREAERALVERGT
ncbi:MAG: hypothetical protein IJI21_02770 [Clostridia bacterium]|nr:hypothetical protein [Clostridia bacterium]